MLPGKNFRITGITFKGGTGTGLTGSSRLVVAPINRRRFAHRRFDHLHFTGQRTPGAGIEIYAGIRGVQDPSFMTRRTEAARRTSEQGEERIVPIGDIEWSQPSGFGGPDFWFIEDCWVNNDSGQIFSPLKDGTPIKAANTSYATASCLTSRFYVTARKTGVSAAGERRRFTTANITGITLLI